MKIATQNTTPVWKVICIGLVCYKDKSSCNLGVVHAVLSRDMLFQDGLLYVCEVEKQDLYCLCTHLATCAFHFFINVVTKTGVCGVCVGGCTIPSPFWFKYPTTSWHILSYSVLDPKNHLLLKQYRPLHDSKFVPRFCT